MKAKFHASQLDQLFQFVAETSGFGHRQFDDFLEALRVDHLAYRQWEFETVCRQNAIDEVYRYVNDGHQPHLKALGIDLQIFLRFVFEKYGLNRDSVENFKKSLAQVKPYQEWLAAKTSKKTVAKRQTGGCPTNAAHLRLVK